MLNQSFSARGFKRLLRNTDLYKYKLGKTPAEQESNLRTAAEHVTHKDFLFANFNSFHFSHGNAIGPSCIADDFAVRKLNDNIKRVFSVKTADRNRIVPQIKVLLGETGEFWLYKLDVKQFFESINKTKVIELVCDDARLSFESKRILKNLFNSSSLKNSKGLPRGISLSSTLAEIYLQKFDDFCKTFSKCYYYARYVDDIIILFHEPPGDFLQQASAQLPSGLEFNTEKTEFMYRPRNGNVQGLLNPLTFLGYEFNYECTSPKQPANLIVGISAKKIGRLKSRIALSLFEFARSKDVDLLKKRIRFLSSNFKIDGKQESGNLYAGIYFSNCIIDDERIKDLKGLDEFLRKCVYSKKGSLGKKLNGTLSASQKIEICSLSFVKGFELKVIRHFHHDDLYEIKKAWKHVK